MSAEGRVRYARKQQIMKKLAKVAVAGLCILAVGLTGLAIKLGY